jgi:tetratricopeptide (TPR) repeat protein
VRFVDEAMTLDLSEADLTAKIQAAPREPRILLYAAHWYDLRGRRKQALGYYDRALAADPTNAAKVAELAVWEGDSRALAPPDHGRSGQARRAVRPHVSGAAKRR